MGDDIIRLKTQSIKNVSWGVRFAPDSRKAHSFAKVADKKDAAEIGDVAKADAYQIGEFR